jgi:ribose transport system permease protein
MKLLAGSGIGLINGMVIAVGGLPAFVTTLGMMAVSNVLSLGTTGGATVSGFPKKFLRLGQGAL